MAQQVNDRHLLPRFRRSQPEPPPLQRSYASSADERHLRLRGIPVLTQGVGGAVLGSRPERAILKLDRRQNAS
jgi:hypothetical protein